MTTFASAPFCEYLLGIVLIRPSSGSEIAEICLSISDGILTCSLNAYIFPYNNICTLIKFSLRLIILPPFVLAVERCLTVIQIKDYLERISTYEFFRKMNFGFSLRGYVETSALSLLTCVDLLELFNFAWKWLNIDLGYTKI